MKTAFEQNPIGDFIRFMDDGHCVIMEAVTFLGVPVRLCFSYDMFDQLPEFIASEHARLRPFVLKQAEAVLKEKNEH